MTKNTLVLAFFLAFTGLVSGQVQQPAPEPPLAADEIHLPQLPSPAPPPQPAPGGVAVLPADTLYVITSAKPFFVLASPAGLVSVEYDTGPQTIVARFVEDPTKAVKRKFADHYITIVRAAGTGRVELLVVPSGVTKESDIIRRLVDAQTAPQPPPQPVPPGPTPPAPAPDGFQAALQAAFALEPAADKANQVKVLAGFYRAAALTTVRNPALATLGDLQDTLKLAVKQIGLPTGALARLVSVIAADEVRALGTNRAQALDQTARDAAASEFVRVAAALEITGGVH